MNPRYRIKGEPGTVVYIGSIGHFAGSEIDHGGWPDPKLVPINEPAHRIARFWGKHSFDPFLPSSPYSTKHNRFYLPGVATDPRATRWPGPPETVKFGMPQYRCDSFEPRFTARAVNTGETIAYLGWPALIMRLVPVNASAADVADYFAENADNPSLLASPWNEFDNSLFLPALPSVAKQRSDAKWKPPTPFSTPRRPIDYPEDANVVTRALIRSM